MRRQLMRFIVYALPVLGGGAAIAQGLARANWPNAAFWTTRGHWILTAIVVAGLIPALQTGISELGERRRRKLLELEDNVRAFLATSLVVVSRECNAPWDQTGLQAFLVDGWLWRKRHVRLSKIRLSSIASSGVRWTRGKGVIGACWSSHSVQWAQLDEAPFSKLDEWTGDEWNSLEPADTYGLSFADYQALGRKYGAVAAVPIMGSNDTYIGCVTLDTPPGVRLESREIAIDSLSTTADLVRRFLRR
jgi:hypothetical protein